MLNWIWLLLLVGGALLAGFTGRFPTAIQGAFDAAGQSVQLAIGLAGIMTLWLGLMRIAEASGLVRIIARALRPVLVRLFPDVPPDHPAMGSMVMNLAANALGLANAATPLGLRAMRDLEKLNQVPGTATDAMCTFLALNTGSVQLLPISAIAVLAAEGSRTPTVIVGTTLLATACSSLAGLIAVKFMARLPMFRIRVVPGPAPVGSGVVDSVPEDPIVAQVPRPARWTWPAMAGLLGCFVWFAFRLMQAEVPAGAVQEATWIRLLNSLSLLSVPLLLAGFPLYAAGCRVPVYEEFIEGAREGFQTSIRIIPYLVAMLMAIGFLRGAGGIDVMARALAVPMSWVGYPVELLPMTLLRPLTGSGTMAALVDLVKAHGPDSLLARSAGTLFGSTETTFYVVAVYFGAVSIRKTRHAVWAGLIADAVGALAAVYLCRAVFAG